MQEIGAELPRPYNPLNEKGNLLMIPKHDEDFYGWAMTNASLLKQKKYQEADMDMIIEELEEMGGSNENQLINRLGVLIAHLLKWQFQPEVRGRSWEGTIEEQRHKIKRLVKKNPSLKTKISEAIEEGFSDSKSIIKKDTPLELKLLPAECPYTFDQIMDDEFYPE